MRVSIGAIKTIVAEDVDGKSSSITRFAVECSCSAYPSLRLPESSRIAMPIVCAYVVVADSRH